MIRRLGTLLALLTMLIPATASANGPNGIAAPAEAARQAVRGVQYRPDADCDLATVEAVAQRHPETRQLVVMSTSSFGATVGHVSVAGKDRGGTWRCQTDATVARFGRSGTRPLLDRRSGDGTSPAGVFPLGAPTAWDGQRVSVFGNRPDPGVNPSIGYRAVRPQDCWGATPGNADYNKLVDRLGCSGPDDEWLQRFGDVYSHAVVIGANMDPISGDSAAEADRAYAAAIFLHRHSHTPTGATRPTSGCVSLPLDALVDTIRLLDPDLDPHFAIGPVEWLRTTA